MISTGSPDLLRFALFDRVTTSTKTQLTIASQELATGRRFDLVSSLGGQVGEFNLVTKARSDIDAASARLGLANNRLAQIGLAFDTIRTTVDGFAEEAAAQFTLENPVGIDAARSSAISHLGSVISAVNTRHAGRSLFAGDDVNAAAVSDATAVLASVEAAIGGATDAATIDAAIATFFGAGGGFETSVYQGGTGRAASVVLPNGAQIDYNETATAQPFKDVLEGLVRIIFAPSDADGAWGATAASKLNAGTGGLIEVRANVGRQQTIIDNAVDVGEQEKLTLNQLEDTLVGVDAFEAAARVQRLEIQLEAAFTVTARLSQLTFANFIG